MYQKGFLSVDAGFVAECDRNFELVLEKKVAELCHKKESRILGLTGPTCSGKTTAAKKLIAYLGDEKKRVITVSLDDFFKNNYTREMLKDRDVSKLDFDSPDTLDRELFEGFMDDIFTKGRAEKPIFDFATGTRAVWETVECDADDILLLEGIQVLYPAVIDIIEDCHGSVMAVRTESGIDVEGRRFEPNFIRFCRRLVRDYNFRSAGPELTFPMWSNVSRNEQINIFPHMHRCDICIDTTLAFELNMLSPYVRRILCEVDESRPYYEDAQSIIRALDGICEIGSECLSENSLYKEFV